MPMVINANNYLGFDVSNNNKTNILVRNNILCVIFILRHPYSTYIGAFIRSLVSINLVDNN